MKKVVQPQDKYVLRLPDGMRERLRAAAEANGRSMNAEINHRLEQSFEGPATITMEIKRELNLAVKEFLEEGLAKRLGSSGRRDFKDGDRANAIWGEVVHQLGMATDEEMETDGQSDEKGKKSPP